MTRPVPFPIAMFGSSFDPAEQLLKQDAAAREFALCTGRFLQRAFPAVQSEDIDQMRDAWVDWMTCGTAEQLKSIERSRAEFARYQPVPPEEELTRLVEERDSICGRIAQAEAAAKEFPVEGMQDIIDATMISPMRRELEFCEARISGLQKHMESANAGKALPANEGSEERQQQKEETT